MFALRKLEAEGREKMLLDMKYVILNKNKLEARDVADPVLKHAR